DRGLDVLAQQGAEVDGVVLVEPVEGRVALVAMPRGEVPAVVGQLDGQGDGGGGDQEGGEAGGGPGVGDIQVIGVGPEQPGAGGRPAGPGRGTPRAGPASLAGRSRPGGWRRVVRATAAPGGRRRRSESPRRGAGSRTR